ncbi:DUF1311 domain-containing protein [Clostridium sp. YIM B02505]|uniref:DUF1311 domain-containing protein n=1 Tax=Clostridium yunnanense TaxID=2800325 RepID=A0ABS1EWQ1_9CLOT|nr:lysozyme inhibitor LprI family protein [Clostridium yunnanense]MBK1813810.1 DUF1311 domain-containing protein [Clostridium yunnanense]
MRKSIFCLVFAIGLTLVGCQNNDGSKVASDSSKNSIESNNKNNAEDINGIIDKLEALVNEKKYVEANELITELNSKELNNTQKNTINDLKIKVASSVANSKNDNQKNNKQQYKEKLDKVEKSLKYLDDPKYSATTLDMRKAAGETYKQWDGALNEIYGVLKKQLSQSEINELQAEEVKWITYRDKKAEEDSARVKGGTLEPVEHTYSLANTTKSRCYELVEKYMK